MRLGIDFGTTRIVAAAVDRGNYPVVSFHAPDGSTNDWFPPLIGTRDSQRHYGWDAWLLQADPSYTILRSLKRWLEDAGPNTLIETGQETLPLMDLLTGLTCSFRQALVTSSTLEIAADEPLEVMLGVPANANSNQRFLTAEAFRRAGFQVLGILNEPSAASIEYGHRNNEQSRQLLLVYDLGGGTFDASLVEHDALNHTVMATEGISTLGGDDFDHVLAELALAEASMTMDDLTQSEAFRLLEECRHKKEGVHPNTRKITIDLGILRDDLPEVSIPVAAYYESVKPYVEETLHCVRDLLAHNNSPQVDCLYMSGGGSELPIIARQLREEFGRRVKRSAVTRSATAIGLAIQADATAGYQLRDRFTRYFGVWREGECGSLITFDPLYPKGTALPVKTDPPLEITRRYQPVHNIGHFRYLECTDLLGRQQPAGDITIWDEILFPFDPSLSNGDLSSAPVHFSNAAASQWIEESYRCDAGGSVLVTIRNLSSGYERSYPLGRWSVATKPITPARRKRSSGARA